jgi:hypothetical protein
MMWIRFHCLQLCGVVTLLLLNPNISAFASSSPATATGEVEIQHSHLKRRSVPEDGQILKPCKPSQVKSVDACIVALPTFSALGPVKNDMYTNSIDTLALSQYIYEITDLRRIAHESKNQSLKERLDVSLKKPKSFHDIHQVLKTNLDTLK